MLHGIGKWSRATTDGATRDTDDGGSLEIVADAVGVETDELAELNLEVPIIGDRAAGGNTVYDGFRHVHDRF